jgi:hypothetical protein
VAGATPGAAVRDLARVAEHVSGALTTPRG